MMLSPSQSLNHLSKGCTNWKPLDTTKNYALGGSHFPEKKYNPFFSKIRIFWKKASVQHIFIKGVGQFWESPLVKQDEQFRVLAKLENSTQPGFIAAHLMKPHLTLEMRRGKLNSHLVWNSICGNGSSHKMALCNSWHDDLHAKNCFTQAAVLSIIAFDQ